MDAAASTRAAGVSGLQTVIRRTFQVCGLAA